VDGLGFKRPSWERAAEMARTLHRRGVLAKLRHSAGQDVHGGCGQLRARVVGGSVDARLPGGTSACSQSAPTPW
jgi:23S rRNA (adenine2503-C2)-methyltransferase